MVVHIALQMPMVCTMLAQVQLHRAPQHVLHVLAKVELLLAVQLLHNK